MTLRDRTLRRSVDRARRSRWTVLALISAGCGGSTTSVMQPPVQVLVASGDAQFGTANRTAGTPLTALVRALTTDLPQPGVEVVWSVQAGDADIVGTAATVSDSTGLARTTVRFGTNVGDVVIRATAQGQSPAYAEFRLFLVDTPVLTGVSDTLAAPGASITLTGSNFVPSAQQNVVLFSGIRGSVTAASPDRLTVTVPPCLPERDVEVSVQLGAVSSASLPLSIGPGGAVANLAPGDVVDAFDAAGLTCVTVSGAGGARYLVQLHSTSSAGAATHAWRLSGLSSDPSLGPPLAVESARGRLQPGVELVDFGGLWDEQLRTLEEELMMERRGEPGTEGGPSRAVGPSSVPPLNQVRDFKVYRGLGDFADVTAVARHIGERAALFVDVDAPSGGYSLDDLRAFSDEFDGVIWPTVVAAYGQTSDLDQNDRIVILFTPAVNAATPRGSNGFVGGFFYGGDLLPGPNSNSGEVFYALVPDPAGQYSDPRPKAALQRLTPAVLAHEFQHMVNFNQRVLERGAAGNDALWLSEALAQFAEEQVAREYESRGDSASVEIFRSGARDRARRYLAETGDVSLVIASGNGSLAERGASFLYLLYLTDRFGVDLAGRLARTTRTGVMNVEAETGTDWATGLSDWWTAIVRDGPGSESGPHVYPSLDLHGILGDPFPLDPSPLGRAGFTRSGTLRSASVEYYIVNPVETGTTTLRLGGEGGGASAPQAGLRMRILRIE